MTEGIYYPRGSEGEWGDCIAAASGSNIAGQSLDKRKAPHAEDFLSQAYRIDQQIQSKVAQLDRLRACASGSGIRYGDVKVQTSGPPNRVEDAVLKIMEEERAINEEIDRLVETKRQIREVINRVEDVDNRLLLEKRNLLFMTWVEIARDMNMSLRWVQSRHKDAVRDVQGILDRMEWGV